MIPNIMQNISDSRFGIREFGNFVNLGNNTNLEFQSKITKEKLGLIHKRITHLLCTSHTKGL